MPVAVAPTALIDHAVARARAADALPVHHHAGLRQGEGQKRADGEQRDQPVRDAAEDRQQQARDERPAPGSHGIDQAPPARAKRFAADSPVSAMTRQSRGKSANEVLAEKTSTSTTEEIATK